MHNTGLFCTAEMILAWCHNRTHESWYQKCKLYSHGHNHQKIWYHDYL